MPKHGWPSPMSLRAWTCRASAVMWNGSNTGVKTVSLSRIMEFMRIPERGSRTEPMAVSRRTRSDEFSRVCRSLAVISFSSRRCRAAVKARNSSRLARKEKFRLSQSLASSRVPSGDADCSSTSSAAASCRIARILLLV